MDHLNFQSGYMPITRFQPFLQPRGSWRAGLASGRLRLPFASLIAEGAGSQLLAIAEAALLAELGVHSPRPGAVGVGFCEIATVVIFFLSRTSARQDAADDAWRRHLLRFVTSSNLVMK